MGFCKIEEEGLSIISWMGRLRCIFFLVKGWWVFGLVVGGFNVTRMKLKYFIRNGTTRTFAKPMC